MIDPELAPTQEIQDYEISRGEIKIPHLPEVVESAEQAYQYLSDFVSLNDELMEDDGACFEGVYFVVPASENKPAVLCTPYHGDKKSRAEGKDPYDPYTFWTSPVGRAGKFETCLQTFWILKGDDDDAPHSCHIELYGVECGDSDRDWGNIGEDQKERMKSMLPTIKQALEGFVELIK